MALQPGDVVGADIVGATDTKRRLTLVIPTTLIARIAYPLHTTGLVLAEVHPVGPTAQRHLAFC